MHKFVLLSAITLQLLGCLVPQWTHPTGSVAVQGNPFLEDLNRFFTDSNKASDLLDQSLQGIDKLLHLAASGQNYIVVFKPDLPVKECM
jgi:hypothetical protein